MGGGAELPAVYSQQNDNQGSTFSLRKFNRDKFTSSLMLSCQPNDEGLTRQGAY